MPAWASFPVNPDPDAAWTVVLQGQDQQQLYPTVQKDARLDALQTEYGGLFHMMDNPLTGTAHLVWGTGINIPGAAGATDAQLEQAARTFIDGHAALFGAASGALQHVSVRRFGGKAAVWLRQQYQGVPVETAGVTLVFDAAGNLLAFGSDASQSLTLNTVPTVSASQSLATAKQGLGFNDSTDTVLEQRLSILQLSDAQSELMHRLAWLVRLETQSPLGVWRTAIDAHSGEVLERSNERTLAAVFGTVDGEAHAISPCEGPPVTWPFAMLKIRIDGDGETVSAAGGQYSLAHSLPAPVRLIAGLAGTAVSVVNVNGNNPGNPGPNASFDQVVPADGQVNVHWSNQQGVGDGFALLPESNCYYHTTKLYGFLTSLDPELGLSTSPIALGQIRCNVGYNRQEAPYCLFVNQGWYIGGTNPSISFCPEVTVGGTVFYDAARFGDLIYHEYGHHLHLLLQGGGFFTNKCLAEGLADMAAMVLTRRAGIMYGADSGFTCSQPRRDADASPLNYRTAAFDPCPGNSPAHAWGRLISGFYWHAYENLVAGVAGKAPMQDEGAWETVTQLWYGATKLGGGRRYADQVLLSFIMDDDDGTMLNGTPHFEALCQAAELHGFECPVLADVRFADESDATSITYPGGHPYAAVPFDYDGDAKQDLMVSMRNDVRGELFGNAGNLPSGIPQFNRVTSVVFQPGPVPDFQARGLAVADIENDGDLDVFAAHETTPRLYRNDLVGGQRRFVDVSSSLGVSALGTGSWAGAWGDADRDGWVDLYVARATGTPPADGGGIPLSPDPTWIAGHGAQDRLLRSTLGTGGGFVDVTQQSGLHMEPSETIAASWADIDGDKDLDLYVAWLGPPNAALPFDWSPLYLNQGDGTFVDVAGNTTGPRIGRLRYVSGSAWADFNQDGYLDIGLVRQKPGAPDPQSNAFICLNNGQGDLTTEPQYGVNGLEPVQGLSLADFDLNGFADLLTVPAADQGPVRLYLGHAPTAGIQYVERGFVAGLTTGKADGIAAADFTGDGDVDAYIGRLDTAPFYFQNKASGTSDSPKNNWIGIKLQATAGGNNRAGIGTHIKVQVPPTGTPLLVQARTVDGGMGRGGQSSLVQLVGLGQLTSDVKLTTTWGDGFVQETIFTYNANPTLNQLNRVQTITEQAHAPEIISKSLTFLAQPKPNLLSDWLIGFKVRYNVDPSTIEVAVENNASPWDPQCYSISPTVLKQGVPGVTCSVEPIAGGYLCEVPWSDVPCTTVCSYRAKNPKCAMGGAVSTSNDQKILTQNVCVQ